MLHCAIAIYERKYMVYGNQFTFQSSSSMCSSKNLRKTDIVFDKKLETRTVESFATVDTRPLIIERCRRFILEGLSVFKASSCLLRSSNAAIVDIFNSNTTASQCI